MYNLLLGHRDSLICLESYRCSFLSSLSSMLCFLKHEVLGILCQIQPLFYPGRQSSFSLSYNSSWASCRLWLHRGIAQLISGIPHVALLADGKKVSMGISESLLCQLLHIILGWSK